MRLFAFLVPALLSSLVLYAQRNSQRINFDWKFIQKDISGAESPSFDDSKWQTVHLPHDASIYGPFVQDSLNSNRENGFLPRLKGWYRKSLVLGQEISGRKVFLEFEGVYRDVHVYINGQHVAHQLNGYQAFLVDITSVAKPGANTIAVSYDNTYKESSRWYNGEGIYRDVWLLITEPVHVNYHGTYVSTPFITREKATVSIQTEVINEGQESTEVVLVSKLLSPDGKTVGEISNTVPVGAGELYAFLQQLPVVNPMLWSLSTPHLYRIVSSVYTGDRLVDTYYTTFGIRSIEFDRDMGLLVNGQKVLVKGVNIHHDLGPLGAAAFERAIERRLEGLKRLGCNGVRLSHNPHDEYILDWCDRNGMLVLDEAFDKWVDQFFGKGNSFDDHWKESLEAFIKRDRNHPSVFLWSVGNETHQQRDPKADFGIPQLKKMVEFVHQLEPSRKVTCGLHPSRKSGAYRTENYYREGPPEMEFYMDVVSTNYREEFWPVDKAKYPQLMFILSEAQVGNLGNEWFNFNHENSVGLFYWGGTDYIGESFGWPATGWPNGIIDWNDHWKPFSYYINSLFSEEPMVYVTSYDKTDETARYWNEVQLRYQPLFSHWNWQGKDSVKLLTFTNCQEVELFLNGKSLGIKKVPAEYYTKEIKGLTAEEYDPDHPVNTGPDLHKKLEWMVPFEPGVIRAESRINGKVVARHELRTAGEPYQVVLEADRDNIRADGLDLSYITVKVTDKDGTIIPNARDVITFTVTGAGSNAGVGNADLASHESFTGNQRKVFQGKALLIVRSAARPGVVKIKAAAQGLKTGTLTINVE